MALIYGKTLIKLIATLLVALALFSFDLDVLHAQGPSRADLDRVAQQQPAAPAPDSVSGPATIAEDLGITGYRKNVFEALVSLGTMIAWLGGSLFDISIAVFTSGMAATAKYLGLDVAVTELWAIVRDVFNLLFIFGLIYAGFKIILDANDAASKRTVGMIVVAALLINFSLYAAQVVVDFTNVASYQIHQLIAGGDTSGKEIFGIRVPNTTNQFVIFSGIRGTTNKDQLDVLKKEVADQTNQSSVNTIGSAIVLGVMFCIFYTILGFIFAACAIILLTRFFALIFLMIFSPLMFLGWVLPNMKDLSSKWWKYFSNQALVGPALLFMIYLSLRAMQGIGTTGQDGGLMVTALYLIIVSAFLLASLKVAKSFGAYGTQMAINMGNGARGYAGRWAIGRHADRLNRAMEEAGWNERNPLRKMVSGAANAKFGGSHSAVDARTSREKAAQKGARFNQLHGEQKGKLSAIGIGRRQGGISQAITTSLTNTKDEDARIEMERAITSASNEQIIEMLGKQKADSPEYAALVASMSSSQFDAAMKAKPEELDDGAKGKLASERKVAVEKYLNKEAGSTLDKTIKNASDAQLRVLGTKEIKEHAADLKQSQFDAIVKPENKDYTETEKDSIRKAREDKLWERFDKEPESVFKGKKDPEIAKLPDSILTDPNASEYITGGALKKIMDDGSLTTENKAKIKQNISDFGINESANEFFKSPQGKFFV